MTVEQQQKLATHIFRILKVTDISFPIGRTNKGDLSLKFTKDKEGFELILDAVPLNEKEYDNRELKSIITKYVFDKEEIKAAPDTQSTPIILTEESSTPILKKRGRPFGSKNKPQEA